MKRYTIQLSMLTASDQDVEVSDAEDGGIQLTFKDSNDDKAKHSRLYIQLDEVDSLIEMFKIAKETQK